MRLAKQLRQRPMPPLNSTLTEEGTPSSMTVAHSASSRCSTCAVVVRSGSKATVKGLHAALAIGDIAKRICLSGPGSPAQHSERPGARNKYK